MDFHSPMPIKQFDSPTVDRNFSQNEEYLQYRDLVFQELKSEYGKGASQEFHADVRIPTGYESILDMQYPLSPGLGEYEFTGHPYSDASSDEHHKGDNTSDSIDDLSKDSPTQSQPAWDDSDLKTELLVSHPVKSYPDTQDGDLKANLLAFSDRESPDREDKTGLCDTANLLSLDGAQNTKSPSSSMKSLSSSESYKFNSPPQTPLSPGARKRATKSHILKQKNDRRAILQKLSSEDTENDSFSYGNGKPWYNPRSDRLNSQNLQICYINDTSSSSDSDDNPKNATSPTSKPLISPSPAITPLSPTLLRRNMLNRMQSSSSISSASSGGYRTSTSSPPCDREIINVRASLATDEQPRKTLSKQEEIEQQARIAITQAHQEAKRLAEQERVRSRKESSSSFNKLRLTPFDEATRVKVKSRSLDRSDCRKMSIAQLQIILNGMHAEKETLNLELKTILEIRDELRTEQDAKLIDVEDMKAMLAETGPETTV